MPGFLVGGLPREIRRPEKCGYPFQIAALSLNRLECAHASDDLIPLAEVFLSVQVAPRVQLLQAVQACLQTSPLLLMVGHPLLLLFQLGDGALDRVIGDHDVGQPLLELLLVDIDRQARLGAVEPLGSRSAVRPGDTPLVAHLDLWSTQALRFKTLEAHQ